MQDAIIISDLHLGSDTCQVELIKAFLDDIEDGTLATRELILNGDVFESHDFRRLSKCHWKILGRLRKMSNHMNITWLAGNHDGTAESMSTLLGIAFKEEHMLLSGPKKVLCLHGHIYDDFLTDHPILTLMGDWIYYVLQKLDPSFGIARRAKKSSKTFVRCIEKVQKLALAHARKIHADVVCCGHTHMEAEVPGEVSYYNSGCWTERPCTFLQIADGSVRLHRYNGRHSSCL
ncbi:MAG: UDP-2,3-diacylglucosamine diphosphatase [Minisyncoccia bacterium]